MLIAMSAVESAEIVTLPHTGDKTGEVEGSREKSGEVRKVRKGNVFHTSHDIPRLPSTSPDLALPDTKCATQVPGTYAKLRVR